MGAHFEALYIGILIAASDCFNNFFRILTFGFEQCVKATLLGKKILCLESDSPRNSNVNHCVTCVSDFNETKVTLLDQTPAVKVVKNSASMPAGGIKQMLSKTKEIII